MSDRHFAYTVSLEKDIRDDDSEAVINAIRMIKGVASVVPHVSSIEFHVAETRVRREMRKRIYDAIDKTE